MVANDGLQSHSELRASKTGEFSFADVNLTFHWLHVHFVLRATPSVLGMKDETWRCRNICFRTNFSFVITAFLKTLLFF